VKSNPPLREKKKKNEGEREKEFLYTKKNK